MSTEQMEMAGVAQLVPEKHGYRKLRKLLDFERIGKSVKVKTRKLGAMGFGRLRLIMCLILQFMEDVSDREFERFLSANNAAKWFCGFGLLEKTPDFTTIRKFRNLIGTTHFPHPSLNSGIILTIFHVSCIMKKKMNE